MLAASDDEPDSLDLTAGEVRPLRELVAESGPGLTVDVTETGDPDRAPPSHRLVVRHLVMEAMLNAGKYAPGGSVTVHVAGQADRVTVTVTSLPVPTAGAVAPPRQPSGSAVGLRALTDRCAALGGRMSAGHDADGTTFTVHADLPYQGAP